MSHFYTPWNVTLDWNGLIHGSKQVAIMWGKGIHLAENIFLIRFFITESIKTLIQQFFHLLKRATNTERSIYHYEIIVPQDLCNSLKEMKVEKLKLIHNTRNIFLRNVYRIFNGENCDEIQRFLRMAKINIVNFNWNGAEIKQYTYRYMVFLKRN